MRFLDTFVFSGYIYALSLSSPSDRTSIVSFLRPTFLHVYVTACDALLPLAPAADLFPLRRYDMFYLYSNLIFRFVQYPFLLTTIHGTTSPYLTPARACNWSSRQRSGLHSDRFIPEVYHSLSRMLLRSYTLETLKRSSIYTRTDQSPSIPVLPISFSPGHGFEYGMNLLTTILPGCDRAILRLTSTKYPRFDVI